MNRHSNLMHGSMLAGSLLLVGLQVMLPVSVAATASPFCTNLPTKASTITTQLTNLSNKLTQAWSQQDQKISSDEQAVDQKIADARQAADTARDAEFAKLQAKAVTDDEKRAVATFVTAVTNAITTRRTAYDSARQTFRAGLTSAVTTRRGTVSAQLGTFKSSATTALSTAEASCASTPTQGVAIRTTLVDTLKTARTTFQSDRQEDAKVGPQVQQLAATRNAAFKAADQTFESSMATARTALQQVFSQSGGTI